MTNTLLIFDLQGTLARSMRPPILNGSTTTLQQLSKTNTLALFTGASRTETLNILKNMQILPLFDLKNIITKGQFPPKPNPSAIFWLLANTAANTTYYIGDTKKDYQTAKNARIPFIYIGKQKLGITQINSLDQLLNVTIKL